MAVSVLFHGEAEALIDNTSIKVQVNDDLLLAVDRLFSMRVVEFG